MVSKFMNLRPFVHVCDSVLWISYAEPFHFLFGYTYLCRWASMSIISSSKRLIACWCWQGVPPSQLSLGWALEGTVARLIEMTRSHENQSAGKQQKKTWVVCSGSVEVP
ncbi:hypothetical protein FRC18_001563 [Serendipita sp. 400]|nr:hypothetical protein FRC18_001563 [Serendipita sp. 400]